MAQTIVPVKLSASSDCEPLAISSTTSSGATTIHIASGSSGTNSFDEVYLWAINSATGTIALELEIGSTATAHVQVTNISAKAAPTLVLPGLRVEKGVAIKGWKGTATLTTLAVYGNVNRFSS